MSSTRGSSSHSQGHFPALRKCFVPSCKNSSWNNRNLVYVPVKKSLKMEWCRLVGRDCPKSQLYCCELHLDLQKDLDNYDKWRKHGGYPIMNANATLKAFKKVIAPDGQELSTSATNFHMEISQISVGGGQEQKSEKGIQVKPQLCDKETNYSQRSQPMIKSPISYQSVTTEGSEEKAPLQSGSSYEPNTSSSPFKGNVSLVGRQKMLDIVRKYPLLYLGIPKKFYNIINLILEQYTGKTKAFEIIVTLYKIRQNDTLVKICHLFQVTKTRLQKMFFKNVVLLASYFQNLIFMPDLKDIKRNMPAAFKIRYSNVQCIIDCFEIQIEHPKNPVKQALTWSQYKAANTIKYLVAATPDGLVTYVSPGYGGRISDKHLTEISSFIDALPTNLVIMADRGFKEIQSVLSSKNIKLLRPPSVFSNEKPTKAQVIETKVIASLRVHIERVIRRLREFKVLKPHSVVHHKHVNYLDEYVIIASGLINLQNSIIKQY